MCCSRIDELLDDFVDDPEEEDADVGVGAGDWPWMMLRRRA